MGGGAVFSLSIEDCLWFGLNGVLFVPAADVDGGMEGRAGDGRREGLVDRGGRGIR